MSNRKAAYWARNRFLRWSVWWGQWSHGTLSLNPLEESSAVLDIVIILEYVVLNEWEHFINWEMSYLYICKSRF